MVFPFCSLFLQKKIWQWEWESMFFDLVSAFAYCFCSPDMQPTELVSQASIRLTLISMEDAFGERQMRGTPYSRAISASWLQQNRLTRFNVRPRRSLPEMRNKSYDSFDCT